MNECINSKKFRQQFSEYETYVKEYKKVMNVENLLAMIYNLELSIRYLKQSTMQTSYNKVSDRILENNGKSEINQNSDRKELYEEVKRPANIEIDQYESIPFQ